MPDFTQKILMSFSWFVIGLAVYYLLVAYKVFLLSRLQPMILSGQLDKRAPLKDSFKKYRRALLQGTLHRSALRFIFRYKKANWPEIDNKPVKKRLKIITAIISFLKPFIIFSIIWAALRIWILSNFAYDSLTITLAQVQGFLNRLHQNAFFNYLQNHKAMLLLIFGIICVAVPWLYQRDAAISKGRKIFGIFLLVLTLLGNISFFGAATGFTYGNKTNKLTALKAEIIQIHDSIYIATAQACIISDLSPVLNYIDSSYTKEANRFDSIAKKNDTAQFDYNIKYKLEDDLNKVLNDFKTAQVYDDYDLDSATKATEENMIASIKHTPVTYSFFEADAGTKLNILKDNPGSFGAVYFNNKAGWNKGAGTELLTKANGLKQAAASVDNNSKRLAKLVEHFFDFGFGELSEFVSFHAGFKGQKTIIKIYSILFSENYQKSLSEKVAKTLASVKKKMDYFFLAKDASEKWWSPQKEMIRNEVSSAITLNDLNVESIQAEAMAKQHIQNEASKLATVRKKIDARALEVIKNKYELHIYDNDDLKRFEKIMSDLDPNYKPRAFKIPPVEPHYTPYRFKPYVVPEIESGWSKFFKILRRVRI